MPFLEQVRRSHIYVHVYAGAARAARRAPPGGAGRAPTGTARRRRTPGAQTGAARSRLPIRICFFARSRFTIGHGDVLFTDQD